MQSVELFKEKSSADLKILLVEDDYVDQKSFIKTLGKLAPGYQISTADSVETATDKISNENFDVIVTDYFLPDGTGLDIINKFQDKLFVFVTGSDQTQTAIEAMKAGAKEYLIKDYNLNYLSMAPVVIDKIYKNSQSETRAKEVEKRFQELFEKAHDIIQSIDENGDFIFVNPTWNAVLGYSNEEAKQMNFLQIIHPSYHEHCRKILEYLNKGETLTGVEIKFVSKTGEEVYVEGNITPQKELSNSSYTSMSIFRDVTEKKAAEKRMQEINEELERKVLERTEELQKTNKSLEVAVHELDTFLYRSSHNLMGPIARFEGLINLLKIPEGSIEKSVIIDKFNQNASEMRKMITKLTDVSRINSYDGNEHSKIKVKEFIQNICQEFQPIPSNVFVTYDVSEELTFENDAEIFKIIVFNIIENCFQFKNTDNEKSTIKIRAEFLDNILTVSIEDNGLGIKEEFLERVYDMFFQGTDIANGNGLGLYLVKKGLEKLHGEVKLESEVYKYTKVTFKIPSLNRKS